MIAKRIIFEGQVQGVGFRYTTKETSKGFDIIGHVKNLPEGTVELIVMGETDEIDEFLQEISEESTQAHNIKEMHIEKIPLLENVKGFTITR